MYNALDLTHTWVWTLSLVIFIIGYYFISREEKYKLNKANPALFIGTLMFALIWLYFVINWLDTTPLEAATGKLILEISEIFFFLLVAMTFIEVLIDRRVFCVLRKELVHQWYSYKELFWLIWFLTFFLSPITDNLTTALIFATVISTISKDRSFLVPTAINVVVASNAWGVWSPFWDITTLMAWTSGKWDFYDFIVLFPSAFIGWLATAFLLSFYVWKWSPKVDKDSFQATLLPGAKKVILLFISTILIAIVSHQFFGIPAMWWMMLGLALLQLFSYWLKRTDKNNSFNIYANMKKAQMDTLLFFFWILSAVGALHFMGFLDYIVKFYDFAWIFVWNIWIWIFSAFIDNIPIMSAVLKSNVSMWLGDWLFITLTVWIWGSLISFWSAAWVGVMWKLRGIYTFGAHMKFFPIILFWYAVSVLVWYLQFRVLGWC
jgi:Na+/H+ antiporter NhaD/arsenite permease-like protein